MNLFLDTNALVKIYHTESGSDNLLKFLSAQRESLFLKISDITLIEFRSSLYKQVRMGNLNTETCRLFINGFNDSLSNYFVIETNDMIKKTSIKLLDLYGAEQSLRTLDAIQLSTALVSNDYGSIDYFVSSDRKLISIAKNYFNVFNPEDK